MMVVPFFKFFLSNISSIGTIGTGLLNDPPVVPNIPPVVAVVAGVCKRRKVSM